MYTYMYMYMYMYIYAWVRGVHASAHLAASECVCLLLRACVCAFVHAERYDEGFTACRRPLACMTAPACECVRAFVGQQVICESVCVCAHARGRIRIERCLHTYIRTTCIHTYPYSRPHRCARLCMSESRVCPSVQPDLRASIP